MFLCRNFLQSEIGSFPALGNRCDVLTYPTHFQLHMARALSSTAFVPFHRLIYYYKSLLTTAEPQQNHCSMKLLTIWHPSLLILILILYETLAMPLLILKIERMKLSMRSTNLQGPQLCAIWGSNYHSHNNLEFLINCEILCGLTSVKMYHYF